MDNIILYLLTVIQEQYKTICWLLNLICRYIPLKQWAFNDSHSPKYQKFTTDRLPVIKPFIKQDWQFLLEYFLWKYGKPVRPVQRRNGKSIPEDIVCPLCGALIIISMITMVGTDSICARSVARHSSRGRVSPRRSASSALTADTPPSLKRTGNSFACTNVSIPSAPSICITFPGLIKNIWTRTMA